MEVHRGEAGRSRFVAREFAYGCDDLFAETPPLSAARTVLSFAASKMLSDVDLTALDVGCALLHLGVDREPYMDLKSEDEWTLRWQTASCTVWHKVRTSVVAT